MDRPTAHRRYDVHHRRDLPAERPLPGRRKRPVRCRRRRPRAGWDVADRRAPTTRYDGCHRRLLCRRRALLGDGGDHRQRRQRRRFGRLHDGLRRNVDACARSPGHRRAERVDLLERAKSGGALPSGTSGTSGTSGATGATGTTGTTSAPDLTTTTAAPGTPPAAPSTTVVPPTTTTTLPGVPGFDCTVVGTTSTTVDATRTGHGLILSTMSGGSSWTAQRVPATAASFTDISCPTPGSCAAIGTSIATTPEAGLVVLTGNGTHPWKHTATVPVPQPLAAVSCASVGHCVMAGEAVSERLDAS